MTDVPTPRRRPSRNTVMLAAAGAFVIVTVALLLVGVRRDPMGEVDLFVVASLPPASPGVVSTGYVGSRWRLTAATDRRGTTEIPETVDAWLDLATDGRLSASDSINSITARFAVTSAGFDVTEAATTLVGYAGDDAAVQAAGTGMGAMAFELGGPPVHVTVVSANRERLDIQAGGMRLQFARTGASGNLVGSGP